MVARDDEDQLLRSVAIQNAQAILLARQRAEEELIRAKESLELKTRELARSLALMHATLESTTDGILVTDERGKITGFNEKYARLTGIPTDVMASGEHRQLLGVVSRLFENPEAFVARIDEINAGSPAESFDVLELADGRVFERFSRVQVVDGRTVGRVWSFRDVTERRRSDEALRDETRILELLNETGVMLSSSLDLHALVQAVTDAATKLSGASFGAFFYNTIDPHGAADMLDALSGAPREGFAHLGEPRAMSLFGPTFTSEKAIRCDDVREDPCYGGTEPRNGMPFGHLPVRSYLAVPVVSRSGDVIGGLFFGHSEVGVFTPRTERIITGVAAQAAVAIDNARLYEAAQSAAEERKRLLESERFARAEAERMSDIKDEFLATLSHELRTPLGAILGWAQVLRRGVRGEADLHRGLEVIERSARSQTNLIEDLLDMSRIASGKMRLDVQPLEPISVMEAALETVRPAAEAKGIRVDKVLDPAAGPVAGDPGRMQQVVWNLLSNAIKFTPRGGKVQAVLQRVNSHVEIRISDTGAGIAPEFLPHVFERFRQADASGTRRFGGVGLGLSIVKHLVELHGGTVHVESAGEGLGSTFSVAIPLTAVYRSTASAPREHPRTSTGSSSEHELADLSGIKVLVVDDDVDARELIERVLADCRAQVLTANSAAAALPLVERERPDVLVSDIGMPDVDGYQLLQRVRALGEERGGKVPAIALSAFAREEDRTRALRSGFLVHLSKPIGSAELIAAVAAVARS